MSRDKQGSKTGRRERHLAREQKMRERKKLRKARAARFAHLPGQQLTPRVKTEMLEMLTVPKLRELATERGVAFLSKDRKPDLIAKIIAAQATT